MFYTLYLGMEVAVALCVCSKCAYISKLFDTFHSRVFYMYIVRTCLTLLSHHDGGNERGWLSLDSPFINQ